MRRPTGGRKALRLSPLVEACRPHSSRVERVPLIAAGAGPHVFRPGRPAAERSHSRINAIFMSLGWHSAA
jgi:hypothetical protein